MQTGLFITLEGIEGAGKSSQVSTIADFFTDQGKEVVLTREPGGTKTGEQIREILLNKDNVEIHSDTELLLMFAARAQHINEVVQPALEKNKIVICDRFTDASYAYQGGGRALGDERIAVLEDWVQGELRPDITFLFDVDVQTGLSRANKRGEADRFEQETVDFFQAVKQTYLKRAKIEPARFRIIDANQGLENVTVQITNELEAL